MNISYMKFITKLHPRTRFRLKKLSQFMGKFLNLRLMGNPFVADKFYPLYGNKYGFVLSSETYKIDSYDKNGIAIPPSYYTHGNPSKEWFLKSGDDDVNNMIDILHDANLEIKNFDRIFEFGSSCGRLIRHLRFLKGKEIWGADISAEHIGWCNEHLSPPFQFITNTTSPHLPFEDGYFNFIYAGSVFTHIDDLTNAWFMELKRILRNDGILYITMHDDSTLDIFKEIRTKDKFTAAIINSKEFIEFERTKGKMFVIGRSVYSHVFYNREYLKGMLETNFDLLSVTPKAFGGTQTAYLLKNSR